jgi:predicted nucleic acid-binding protein
VIVVDASVLATALGDDGPDGDHARARLRGERLSAPELVDLEVTSVLRRQVHSGAADLRRAALALADLAALPLQRAPHRPLLARCWELRDNLTVYDASYAALAEALDVTLLTGDGRLARAPGLRCHVEILRPASLPRPPPSFLSCSQLTRSFVSQTIRSWSMLTCMSLLSGRWPWHAPPPSGT